MSIPAGESCENLHPPQLGDELSDIFVEADKALLHDLHQTRCSDNFGQGSNPDLRVDVELRGDPSFRRKLASAPFVDRSWLRYQ